MGVCEKSKKPSSPNIKVELRITIAMLRKLTLIKSVANNRFGASIKDNIFLSILVPEVFSSSISVGESEKKADSAADTNATIINKRNIVSIATIVLREKDLITIIRGWERYPR